MYIDVFVYGNLKLSLTPLSHTPHPPVFSGKLPVCSQMHSSPFSLLCFVSQGTMFPRLPLSLASEEVQPMKGNGRILDGRRRGESKAFLPFSVTCGVPGSSCFSSLALPPAREPLPPTVLAPIGWSSFWRLTSPLLSSLHP